MNGADLNGPSAQSTGSLTSRTRRSGYATLVQRILTPALSFLAMLLLARGLSDTQYGTFGVFQGLLPYLMLFGGLGLGYAFLRYIPEYRRLGRDSLASRNSVSLLGLVLRAVASLAASVVLVAAYPVLAPLLGIEGYWREFAVFALAAAAISEATLVSQALNALFLHVYAAAAQVAYSAVKAALLLVLVQKDWLILSSAILVELVSGR